MKKAICISIFLLPFLVFQVWAQPIAPAAQPQFPEYDANYFPLLLSAAEEPALSNPNSYRLILHRSLDPTVIIRVEKEGDLYTAYVKQMNGERPPSLKEGRLRVPDGYSIHPETRKFSLDTVPATVLEDRVIAVPTSTVEEFKGQMKQDKFFTQPSTQAVIPPKIRSIWTLEANQGGTYHYVQRVYPEEGWFRSLCLRLISISEIEIQYLY